MIGDEMASRRSARTVCLASRDFEIIFQVTHQAANFSESRLTALGCTSEDLDFMIAVLGPMSKGAERSSEVCVEFYDEAAPDRPADTGSTKADDASDSIVRGRLPIRFASQWNSLVKLVVSSLSPRELFLRTGYEFDEIRAALARLSGAGD
jgi:hypothetical protein